MSVTKHLREHAMLGVKASATAPSALPVPISEGGTGSATKNFVDLTTAQNVAGAKVFTNSLSVSCAGNALLANLQENTSGAGRRVRISNNGTLNTIESATGTGNTELALAVDGTEVLRSTSGNVRVVNKLAVGPNAPTSKLDITTSDYAEPSLNVNSLATASFRTTGHVQMAISSTLNTPYTTSIQAKSSSTDGQAFPIALNPLGGNIGIGTTNPAYQLQLSTDSAAKPATSTWTIASDMRLKNRLADLKSERCAEIVSDVEVFYGEYKEGVYAEGQVTDTKQLMFSAQSVQKSFKQAVREIPFTYAKKEDDGLEEYQEQAFEIVTSTVKEIQVISGVPTQVEKEVENKVMLFDTLEVVDSAGKVVVVEDTPEVLAVKAKEAVLDDDGNVLQQAQEAVEYKAATYKPLVHQVPRMVTKTRPKFKQEVLEDALSLDKDQLYMANFGATKYLLDYVKQLEARIAYLESLLAV